MLILSYQFTSRSSFDFSCIVIVETQTEVHLRCIDEILSPEDSRNVGLKTSISNWANIDKYYDGRFSIIEINNTSRFGFISLA